MEGPSVKKMHNMVKAYIADIVDYRVMENIEHLVGEVARMPHIDPKIRQKIVDLWWYI